jgi:HTH-type transcriptional regulator/antitoxin HigA
MDIKPISDDDLTNAFIRLENIFRQMKERLAEEMEILVNLIEAYEDKYYPI